MNDEEIKKVNPEILKTPEARFKGDPRSLEAVIEKEPKTLNEELESQKTQEAINAIDIQAGEHRRDLKNHGANPLEDGEFIAGVRVIKEKAQMAEDERRNNVEAINNNTENSKKRDLNLTQEEIKEKILEIRKQLDDADRGGSSKEKVSELKRQRDELYKLLDQNEDFEREADEKNNLKSIGNVSDVMEDIKREISDLNSPLFETMKRIKMTEFEINSIEEYLKELKRRKEPEMGNNIIKNNEEELAFKKAKLMEMENNVKKIVAAMEDGVSAKKITI